MLKSELPAPLARGRPGRREFFFPSPEVTVTFSRDREPLPCWAAKRGGFGERDGPLLWRSRGHRCEPVPRPFTFARKASGFGDWARRRAFLKAPAHDITEAPGNGAAWEVPPRPRPATGSPRAGFTPDASYGAGREATPRRTRAFSHVPDTLRAGSSRTATESRPALSTRGRWRRGPSAAENPFSASAAAASCRERASSKVLAL